MMDVHSIPEAIQWHEGMLLAPQHFQQSAWRQEALLHYHLLALAPFHWGIRHLLVDPVLLMHGTFRVVELEAIMPDGLVVTHGPQAGDDLALDLMPYAEEMRQGERTVHVAVPVHRLSRAADGGELGRYDSLEGQPVVDANTGEGEVRIPRLRPRLRLLCTDTPPLKYVSFPLARVRYQNERFTLTDFIPPTCTVSRHSPLGDLCTVIARRLREKAMFLAERVRSPSAAMGTPMVLETQNAIHSLVAALPPFEAALATEVTHPYVLYLALCALVGHVAGVGMSLVPPVFAAYNHNDLRATFAPAQDFIFQALDEGLDESYTAHPFQYTDGMFGLPFEAAWMQARLIIGVRGQTGMSEQETRAWVEGCVISASSLVQTVRERRILGVPRQLIEHDADLVPARGVVLFALTVEPTYMKPHEVLQVFNTTGALRPSEIVLYVRPTPSLTSPTGASQ